MAVDRQLLGYRAPPAGMIRLGGSDAPLLPPLITALHTSMRGWSEIGLSPGQPAPGRVWFAQDGALAFRFGRTARPQPLGHVGCGPNLAAWFVLLDKWMETFVVIARARAVWSVAELAGALTFVTPAFLPAALVRLAPDNWERVATALALAVADGPLMGTPQNRHWG